MFSYSNTTLWKRDRNFFKDKLVYFKSNGPIILSIEFFLKKMGTTHGLIKLSHDHLGKVKPWFIEALQDNSGLFLDKANPNYIEFKFERGVAQKVIAVFKKINHDYCRLECSNILFEEIKQLEHFICNLDVPKKHILKDKYTSPNIHPKRKDSKELVTFLAKFDLGDPLVNDGIPKDEIKRYLKDGEDPNQYNGALTPLDMLFVRRDLTEKPFKRCMLLLLAYHVSLGRVIWGRNSTLEGWGRSLYYPQKTGWVQELLVRVYKQPKPAIAPMRIESNATSSKLITAIIKNNKFIHTILKKTTPTDAFIRDNKLFDLFSVSFEANPNGKNFRRNLS